MERVDLSRYNENQKFFVLRFIVLLFFILVQIPELRAQHEIPQLLEDLKKVRGTLKRYGFTGTWPSITWMKI